MQLTPWRKRREGKLMRFREDIYDLMDRFLAGIPFAESSTEWVPSVDISETDGEFNVRAELPGLDKNDLDVDTYGDILSIKGEKKDEEDKGYYKRESYFGSFQRNIRLPSEVQSDQVEATFKDGILNIKIPKSEEKKARKIQII